MERTRFDKALLEESLEELYEHAPSGYLSIFPDGYFAKVNQTFLDWVGYAHDDLLGLKRFQDFLTVGGRIFYETHLVPLLHMQGFVNEIALELVCRDGRHLPVLVNATQKRDASGIPLLCRVTVFNASERREYERELLVARRRAEQAAERMSRLLIVSSALAKALTPAQVADLIVEQSVAAVGAQAGLVATVTDDGLGMELASAAGYPAELSQHWQRMPLATPAPLTDALRAGEPILLESPEALSARYPQLAALSHSLGVHSVVAIPLSPNGRATGVLGLSFAAAQSFSPEDRTFLLTLARQCGLALERARLYEAERVARTAAQEAVRVRDTFLSVASHELKTPLTSLLGNAQLLQRRLLREHDISERNQRGLEVIVEQAMRLNRMIVEMLDVGRIASGQLSIAPADVDIGALVGQMVAEVQPALTRHALTYHPPAAPLIVHGDALRLGQVMLNLLQNAVKYSPAGGPITVTVAPQGRMACVQVADRGIGIPQAELPRLFQRFYRVSSAEAGPIEGLGIGLYVVREIVMLHGGTVAVESAEGAGSTFRVLLPLAAQAVAQATQP